MKLNNEVVNITLNANSNGMEKLDWKQILKVLIAVLTAIAGSIGVASCMS